MLPRLKYLSRLKSRVTAPLDGCQLRSDFLDQFPSIICLSALQACFGRNWPQKPAKFLGFHIGLLEQFEGFSTFTDFIRPLLHNNGLFIHKYMYYANTSTETPNGHVLSMLFGSCAAQLACSKLFILGFPRAKPPQTGPISFPPNLKPPIPHLNARYLMSYLNHWHLLEIRHSGGVCGAQCVLCTHIGRE
jgi:hypothetical protein